MVFSENIYFLILFTLPAALNVVYNAHIRTVPVMKQDKAVELAECVVFCLAVFIINVLLMRKDVLLFTQYALLQSEELEEFVKETGFAYVDFMIKYFVINIATSIVVIAIWYKVGLPGLNAIGNFFNKISKRPKELPFSDVWSNVFETTKYIDMKNCIVRIERGGTLITAGVVSIYSSPNQQEKEFMLCDTDLVKQIFEDDVATPLEMKMFKQADYEYYNTATDVLIKFYNAEMYDKVYGDKEKEP